MDELISAILKTSESLEQALQSENDDEFERLLTERNDLMEKVDQYRIAHPAEQYSAAAKRMLEAALEIDRRMEPVLTSRLSETKRSLTRLKQNKEVSKKYHPYMNQPNGVFIDSKK